MFFSSLFSLHRADAEEGVTALVAEGEDNYEDIMDLGYENQYLEKDGKSHLVIR